MLNRIGHFDEEELIDALKKYIPEYEKAGKEVCEIPFRDLDKGKVFYGVFSWLAQQWVFTGIKV